MATSMGYHSAIRSTDNIKKAVTRLPNYLRNKFYKEFKSNDIDDDKVDLLECSHWLDERLSEAHNPIALIINAERKQKKEFEKSASKNKHSNQYIHFERIIKTVRSIRKTLRLYVGCVQEIIKYPTVKN